MLFVLDLDQMCHRVVLYLLKQILNLKFPVPVLCQKPLKKCNKHLMKKLRNKILIHRLSNKELHQFNNLYSKHNSLFRLLNKVNNPLSSKKYNPHNPLLSKKFKFYKIL